MNEDKKIFCTQCGGENIGSAKFCSHCGVKLEQPAADTISTNVYADGIFSGESAASSYEKVADAEEIKPQETTAEEEIKINYGYTQDNTYGNNSAYGYSSSQTQYYSTEDTDKVTGGNIGVSIASMVCGILSIVCCCATYFSLALAIAAIVLGVISIVKKYDGQGMAIAGVATGGVGIMFVVLTFIFTFASFGTSSIMEEIMNELY